MPIMHSSTVLRSGFHRRRPMARLPLQASARKRLSAVRRSLHALVWQFMSRPCAAIILVLLLPSLALAGPPLGPEPRLTDFHRQPPKDATGRYANQEVVQ